MDIDFRSTKLATFSLLAVGAIYAVAIGQNIFTSLFWMSLILWCGRSLYNKSNRARKWSIFLFGFHAFNPAFYFIFPLDHRLSEYEYAHYIFLIMLTISIFGIMHALNAKKELMSEFPEDEHMT
jgi:hypothetical protein